MAGEGEHRTNWSAIAATDDFQHLESARRRFVTVALGVFAVAVGGFLVCCGYARDFMGGSVHGGLTVAFTWLLALTVMAWVIAFLYLRFSSRTLMPAAERIADQAERDARGGSAR